MEDKKVRIAYDVVFKSDTVIDTRNYKKGEICFAGLSNTQLHSYLKREPIAICYGHGSYDYFNLIDFEIIEVTKETTTTFKNIGNADKISRTKS